MSWLWATLQWRYNTAPTCMNREVSASFSPSCFTSSAGKEGASMAFGVTSWARSAIYMKDHPRLRTHQKRMRSKAVACSRQHRNTQQDHAKDKVRSLRLLALGPVSCVKAETGVQRFDDHDQLKHASPPDAPPRRPDRLRSCKATVVRAELQEPLPFCCSIKESHRGSAFGGSASPEPSSSAAPVAASAGTASFQGNCELLGPSSSRSTGFSWDAPLL